MVKDKEAWHAAVHWVERVGPTEQEQLVLFAAVPWDVTCYLQIPSLTQADYGSGDDDRAAADGGTDGGDGGGDVG